MSHQSERPSPQPMVDEIHDEDEDLGVFRLAVDDLVPDQAGEVVLFNDSALHSIVLEGVGSPLEEGIIRNHRMHDGVDVSGFRFVRVREDLTIFFSPDLSLILAR